MLEALLVVAAYLCLSYVCVIKLYYDIGTRTAKSAWLEVQYTSSVVFYLDVTLSTCTVPVE